VVALLVDLNYLVFTKIGKMNGVYLNPTAPDVASAAATLATDPRTLADG